MLSFEEFCEKIKSGCKFHYRKNNFMVIETRDEFVCTEMEMFFDIFPPYIKFFNINYLYRTYKAGDLKFCGETENKQPFNFGDRIYLIDHESERIYAEEVNR